MALEIERKYLVKDGRYKELAETVHHIVQGYLSRDPERTVRVRLCDSQGYLTVKGITKGCVREEYEFPISDEDARGMLKLCIQPLMEKNRYIVPYEGHIWEIDEFLGALDSLTVAEIELKKEDEDYFIPPFIGIDVTGDPDYYNSNLSKGIIPPRD